MASTLVGVLAPYLRTELELSVTRLGGLVATYALVSAIASWPSGWLTDMIGGKRTLLLVFVVSTAALVLVSSSRSFSWLLAAMVVAGLANSAANPSTNSLIATCIEPGRQGLVAGIKMAGVQAGVLATASSFRPRPRQSGGESWWQPAHL